MAYNPEAVTLEFKVEVAQKKILLAAGFDESQVYTGENSDIKELPAIICKCQGGPEQPHGTNNYIFQFSWIIQTNTNKDNSGSDLMQVHRRLVKQVKDAVWASMLGDNGINTLHASLTSQLPDFTAFPEIENEGTAVEVRDSKIESSINFRGLFCESDLTDQKTLPPVTPSQPELFQIQMALPCVTLFGNPPFTCSCAPSVTQTLDFDSGISGQYYEFTIRVRGLVETKNYYGGTNDGNYLQTGGQPADDAWNIFSLATSDPPVTYYFNRVAGANTAEIAIDYTCKVLAKSGSTLTFKIDSVDSVEASNKVQGNVVSGITFIGQPYLGQFLQIDAVAVRSV